MRKNIIWIIAFLSLAFLGDHIIGFFLHKTTEKSQFRYSRLYYAHQDADILFVGNSRGLTFYQPEVEKLTSLKTMNLSYNGMPADLAKCLVMDYLDRHKAPKVMVVDVTLCDRENDMLKSGFNLYTSASTRLDSLLSGIQTPDTWAGRKIVYGGKVSWLYRHNSEIFQRVLYYRNKSDEDWLIDRVIGEGAANDSTLKSYQVRMFPNMVAHLKEMVEYAKNKGVEVKLVINPYFPPFAESIRDSFLTPLKSYVESQIGIPIHDFSTVLKEREEIGDFQHANKKGSINFMKILMDEGYFQSNKNYGWDNQTSQHDTNADITDNFTNAPLSDTFPILSSPSAPNNRPIPPATIVSFTENQSPPLKNITRKKRKNQDAAPWISVDTMFSH